VHGGCYSLEQDRSHHGGVETHWRALAIAAAEAGADGSCLQDIKAKAEKRTEIRPWGGKPVRSRRISRDEVVRLAIGFDVTMYGL
jgi:hypothetical protein